MAIEFCLENSGMSPRISFSHDLCHSDVVPVEQRPFRSNSSGLNSSIDFDFCVRESFEQEPSSADELFSDGKLVPFDVKKKKENVIFPPKETEQTTPPLPPTSAPCPDASFNENTKKESSKESKFTRDEADEKQSSKSFWRFKRSSSLNCGSGYGRSLCPLPLLSRSYSTGSAPNVKQAHHQSKDHHSHINHKQINAQKHAAAYKPTSPASYQKPPLKKSYGSFGNGVQINPVLNVPSGNLFGLGSIFFNGKDKRKKKH